MGGLSKYMRTTNWTFLVGCLAIAGIPGLSGFFSKMKYSWCIRKIPGCVCYWIRNCIAYCLLYVPIICYHVQGRFAELMSRSIICMKALQYHYSVDHTGCAFHCRGYVGVPEFMMHGVIHYGNSLHPFLQIPINFRSS